MPDKIDEGGKKTTIGELKREYFDPELLSAVCDAAKGKTPMTIYVTLTAIIGGSLGQLCDTEAELRKMIETVGLLVTSAALFSHQHHKGANESKH